MAKRNWQLIAAAVALAACLPLPAAAEVQGAARCASASWTALAAGECGVGDLHVLQGPADHKEDDSTALMVGGPPIPEPETYALMMAGLVAVFAASRRRRGR